MILCSRKLKENNYIGFVIKHAYISNQLREHTFGVVNSYLDLLYTGIARY